MARQRKILISLPDSLLNEADIIAENEKINRSEFIREAIRLYIREKKNNELYMQLKEGYEEMSEINLDYSNYCVSADDAQQKLYEDRLAECE